LARRKLYVDMTLCIGCQACEAVCEFVSGEKRIRIYEPLQGVYVPIVCRHCERSPCIEVCPTGALLRDVEGAVVVNSSKCIGCLMCVAVCPFGAPFMSSRSRSVSKCDACQALRLQGLPPACAQICPAAAIVYGTLEDISERIRARTAEILARIRLLRTPVRPFLGVLM